MTFIFYLKIKGFLRVSHLQQLSCRSTFTSSVLTSLFTFFWPYKTVFTKLNLSFLNHLIFALCYIRDTYFSCRHFKWDVRKISCNKVFSKFSAFQLRLQPPPVICPYSEGESTVDSPGGYSVYPLEGRCGPPPGKPWPYSVKTKIVRVLIPCLRHLTRNHTLFKTFAKKRYPA